LNVPPTNVMFARKRSLRAVTIMLPVFCVKHGCQKHVVSLTTGETARMLQVIDDTYVAVSPETLYQCNEVWLKASLQKMTMLPEVADAFVVNPVLTTPVAVPPTPSSYWRSPPDPENLIENLNDVLAVSWTYRPTTHDVALVINACGVLM
jgi:hypothetical protein